jgi:mono/diheme cytochrome c family protein
VRALGSAAAVVVATALLAGCGGGDGGGGGASKTTTTTAATSAATGATSGKAIFTTVGCSTCHTLAAAGAKGQVGPDLDTLKPSAALVARQVTHGGGGMPAFANQLSAQQIDAVARYVARVAGR